MFSMCNFASRQSVRTRFPRAERHTLSSAWNCRRQLRDAPAVLLGCGLRRSEAAALAMGRVERDGWRRVACGPPLARLKRQALRWQFGRGQSMAKPGGKTSFFEGRCAVIPLPSRSTLSA